MAKKNMIARDKKRVKLVLKYKTKRKDLLDELKNTSSFSEIVKLNYKIQKLPRDSAKIRVRNRCWKTGRSQGFYRDFGLSRHALREMGNEGLIPGLRKSSW